ncbi:MAG: DUF58 domain-containing protein [Micrococcales bacterium]|nr:DUF58 domain-containing protein [Micrococcales bacterium]
MATLAPRRSRRTGPPPAPWRLSITARGFAFLLVAAILAWAAATWNRGEAVVAAVGCGAGPVIAFLGLLFAPSRPRYQRELPGTLALVGETMPVRLRQAHATTRLRNEQIVDLNDDVPCVAVPVTWVPHSPPADSSAGQRRAIVGYDLPCSRRGIDLVGPAVIVRQDPCGFVRRVDRVAPAEEVAVGPKPIEVIAPQVLHEGREATSRRINTPRVLDPAAVRDYERGDARRLVHWRATARRQRLMVRSEHPKSDPEVWICVESTLAAKANDDEIERVETAVAVAAQLAQIYLRRGQEVRIVDTGSGKVHAFEPSGGTEPVLRHFAALQLATTDSPLWREAIAQGSVDTGEVVAAIVVMARMNYARSIALRKLRGVCDPALLWLPDSAESSQAPAGWSAGGIALAGEGAGP